jgi:hypothetical protein
MQLEECGECLLITILSPLNEGAFGSISLAFSSRWD